jgi:putative transposase
MGRSSDREDSMSDTRRYRKFTAQQKTEIVLASVRGPKSMVELCREHEIADSLLRKWREQFLAAGAERLQGKTERTEADELRRQVSRLERALGRKTMEVEVAGELFGDGSERARRPFPRTGRRWPSGRGRGARGRCQPSGDLPAPEAPACRTATAAVGDRSGRARRRPREPDRRDPDGRGPGGRELGAQVNRKRVQRLMREHALLQRRRSEGRRRRPGFFRVERPDQLWHLDMTSVWVAEHGWCYLNAAIDCCTREITAWALDVRCRAPEAIAVIEHGAAERGIEPGRLTLGTDNGSAFTSRAFRARLAELEITHRRGGYRDPESQAFIESWFAKLKHRCVWREEFETLDDARAAIGADVDRYHHRPHQGLAYRTPREVAATWKDHDDQLTPAA